MIASSHNTCWGHSRGLTPATWSPTDKDASIILTNGNYTITAPTNDRGGRATLGLDTSTGIGFYAEFYLDIVAYDNAIGVAAAAAPLNGGNPQLSPLNWLWSPYDARAIWTSWVSYGTAMVTGERVKMALQGPNIWWGKVGAGWFTGDPSTGAAPAYNNLSGVVYPAFYNPGSATVAVTANFGQSTFIDPVPAGFEAGWGTVL